MAPASSPLCFVDQSPEQFATAATLSRIPQPASAYNSCTEPRPNPGPYVSPCNLRWRVARALRRTRVGLGLDSDSRGDGLKSTREALLSVATRVVHPSVAGIRAELVLLIEALEMPAPTCPPKPATYSKTVSM